MSLALLATSAFAQADSDAAAIDLGREVYSQTCIAADASKVTFVSDDNVLSTNPDQEEQIFNLELSGSALTQVTNEPTSNRNAFTSYDITDNGDQIVFTTTDDITGDNPTGCLERALLGRQRRQQPYATTQGGDRSWERVEPGGNRPQIQQ